MEVFTAWPAKSTWMILASFAFEMISLSLSPGPCKASVLRLVHVIMFVDSICARYRGVIQAESKIYCILEADLLLSVHQSSFNNKRAAQLQLCISNSCRIGLFSSSPSPIESM